MTDLRTAAQQALEALERARPLKADYTTLGYFEEAKRKHYAAMAALRAALAQQVEPDAYGYASRLAVALWEKHYKDTAPQWKPLPDLLGVLTQIDNMTAGLIRQPEPAQQLEPVQEPVAWMYPDDYAGILKHQSRAEVFQKAWCNPAVCVPLYTAPPQRKPLPNHDQHCVDVPGYGLMAVRLVRAIERAHGITDPQVADRLARHGIPMPEGDPK